MRLTLRTLLAHLDRTLDPEDDAAIAAKLRESEFASKLADRVRACLSSGTLDSPSPLATGTADDPNRIGEYLDSVLSPEQVAEVERICLESDAHLAEVAACHQILTLVLAKPAEIPAPLRSRLYALRPESPPGVSTNNGTFAGPIGPSAGSRPGETLSGETVVSPVGMAGVRPSESPAPPISPVGPDDSGVSDAPTRLKGESVVPPAGRPEPATAGSKKISPSDFSDYSGRPSRVVPWLVSLALIAAFLFVASQAFAPLLQQRSAEEDRLLTLGDPDPQAAVDDEGGRTPADAATDEPGTEGTPLGTAGDREEATAQEPSVSQPLPETPPLPEPPAVVELPADQAAGEMPAGPDVDAPPQPEDRRDAALPVVEELPVREGDMPADPPRSQEDSSPPDSPAVVEVREPPPEPSEVVMPAEGADELPAGDEPIVISSEATLLLVRDPDSDTWMLGEHDDVVQPGSELIGPPLYRNELSLHQQVDLTLVGPARVTLRSAPEAVAELILDYGRFLLAGVADEPRQVIIRFADTDSVLTLPSSDSIAAIEVRSLRPPGMDPENEAATQRVIQVLATSGAPRWRSANRSEVTLESGQLLTLGSGNLVSLTDASTIPDWLDPPVEAVVSLESSAREGLLDLVRDGEAIELSLREAINFRRAEVGALAAQTLLLLGRHDVYFGSEGVFSQVRQRNNWPDHFNAMLNTINRGPETAAAVREAIEQMDAAQADEIYRLLWLFSDRQLAAGGDETLVEALDSSNMTIRVLAAENLRHITGNTLLYKPEVETPSRRASDIKKWETRLRRDEIRWATTEAPAAGAEESGQANGN